MAAKPPTGRLAAGPASNGGARHIAPWATFRDQDEENADLVFPLFLDTYAEMDSNGQVAALLRLIDWAVRNYDFQLHPGDLSGPLLEKLAADTHHQIAGTQVNDEHAAETARVQRRRVLRDILRSLSASHSVFELVGDYDDDQAWRLQDLAFVDPKKLSRWHFGPDDRVEQIDMWGTWPPTELPASRLAVFRFDASPRHPYGQSLLRPLYEDWIAKDRLVRVNMLSHERAGMGIPTVEMSDEAQSAHEAKYLEIVTGIAAGEESGVVMPAGASFDIKGIKGVLPDTLASIRYHDEAMSRTMQGQVAQLGQTENGSGSYALSTSLFDLLDEARDMVAGWIAEAYTEQVVARWCEYNGVELARMPAVRAKRPEPVPVPLQPTDYVALAEAGFIDPAQQAVREAIAKRFGLPLPENAAGVDPAAAAAAKASAALASATKAQADAMGVLIRSGVAPDSAAAQVGLPALEFTGAVPVTLRLPEADAKQLEGGALANGHGRHTDLPGTTPPPVSSSTERAPHAASCRRLAAAPEPDANPGVGHRQLSAVERRARVAFAAIDTDWLSSVDVISAIYQQIRTALTDLAVTFIAATDLLGQPDELAPALRDHLTAQVPGDLVDQAATELAKAAAAGAQQVTDEFTRQGATDVPPGDPEYTDRAASEAALVADQLAVTTAEQAVAAAIRNDGPDDTPAAVADHVRGELEDLTAAHTDRLARGGVARAQRTGRAATIRRHEADVVGIYSSELLDSNTCTACSHVDGTEYPDLDSAMADYPTGGYRGCEGGDQCRGTLVAIHASEQEVTVR
jgi:hypothetical protein